MSSTPKDMPKEPENPVKEDVSSVTDPKNAPYFDDLKKITYKNDSIGFFALKELGSAFKVVEKAHLSKTHLDPHLPFVARLDGHAFRTYSKPFIKPFDINLHAIMAKTMKDLVFEYHASTGYTQSDEITLVFPPAPLNKEGERLTLPFAGKLLKMATLMASFATVRFFTHAREAFEQKKWTLSTVSSQKKLDSILGRLTGGKAYFDARLFSLPSYKHVVQNVMWRSNYDNSRSARLNLGYRYYSNKSLHGKNTREVTTMLEEEKGVVFRKQHPSYQFGTFVKRVLKPSQAVNKKTGEVVQCIRAREIYFSMPIVCDDKYTSLISSKTLNDVEDKDLVTLVESREQIVEEFVQPDFSLEGKGHVEI